MKEYKIQIVDDSQVPFLMDLLSKFDFVKISNKGKKLTAKQKNLVKDMQRSFKEVEQHEKGKLKLKTLDRALSDL